MITTSASESFPVKLQDLYHGHVRNCERLTGVAPLVHGLLEFEDNPMTCTFDGADSLALSTMELPGSFQDRPFTHITFRVIRESGLPLLGYEQTGETHAKLLTAISGITDDDEWVQQYLKTEAGLYDVFVDKERTLITNDAHVHGELPNDSTRQLVLGLVANGVARVLTPLEEDTLLQLVQTATPDLINFAEEFRS